MPTNTKKYTVSREYDAPELVPQTGESYQDTPHFKDRDASAPIPISQTQRDSEGLQMVEVQSNYQDHQSPPPPFVGHEGFYGQQDKPWSGSDESDAKAAATPDRRRRRRWIIGICTAAILIVIIGVVVGVTLGLTQTSEDPEPSPTTGAAAGTSSIAASSTTAAVTSGSTGLAAFSCTPSSQLTNSDTTYTTECYTAYQLGGEDFYDPENTVDNLGGQYTVYTVQQCLTECDQYNNGVDMNEGDAACRAVTYYANLTAPVDLYGGNCFLKSGRGTGYNGDPLDYHHTMSAWMNCLDGGSCA